MKGKFFKKTILLFTFIGLFAASNSIFAQNNECQMIFLRPSRGMAQGIEHVITLNGKEIGRLTNSSMLTYTLKSEGEYELLITTLFWGAPSGTPFLTKVYVNKGAPVYVDLKSSWNPVAGIINAKKAAGMLKKCSYKITGKEE